MLPAFVIYLQKGNHTVYTLLCPTFLTQHFVSCSCWSFLFTDRYRFGSYIFIIYFLQRIFVFYPGGTLGQLCTSSSFNWPPSSCLMRVKSQKVCRQLRGLRHYVVWPKGDRRHPGRCCLRKCPQRGVNGSWVREPAWLRSCFFPLGVPEAEVTWFRNKSKLGSPHHVHEGSLLLTDVSPSDQGLYSCRAANMHGELTENTQLLILGKQLEGGTPQWTPLGVTTLHFLFSLTQLSTQR